MTPHSRLVWTNDEGGDGGPVTTVTFEEKGGKTLLVMHDLYSSKEAHGLPYRNTYTWYFTMKDRQVVNAIAFFDTREFDEFWHRVEPKS